MGPYSFMDVAASLVGPGGVVNLGFGAATADEGISIDMAGDKNTMLLGSDGEGMHSLHAERSGVITCRYLKTSPTNAILQALYDAQSLSATLWGKNVIVVANKSSGDVTTATQCAFKKKPSIHYRKDGDVMEWTFDSIKIDTILGLY